MAQNTLERQLRAGIRAAQQGERDRARELLEGVLRRDRDNELAWIWMASIVTTQKEQRVCLERVLKANPDNRPARQALNNMVGVIGGQQATIDFNAMVTASKVKLAPEPSGGGGRNTPNAPRTPAIGAGLNPRQQRFFLLGGVAVVLVLLFIGSFFLPSGNTPTPTATSNALIVAESSEESTEDANAPVRAVVATATLSGELVQRTTVPTNTPTDLPPPTETPTPTATLPSTDNYALLYSGQQGSASPGLYQISASGQNSSPIGNNVIDFDYNNLSGRIAYVRYMTYQISPATDSTSEVTRSAQEVFVATLANLEDNRQVSNNPQGDASSPALSPDGQRVVYVSNIDGDNEIYLYDINTNTTRQLTDNIVNDADPTWSPNGLYIAFTSDRETPGKLEIFILDTTQSDPNLAITRVTDSRGSKFTPSFSPDGTQLVYAGESGNDINIFITDVSGTGVQQLSRIGGVRDSNPVWTSDGFYIVFISNRETSSGQMYVMTTDGGNVRRIVTDGQSVLTVQVRQ